MKRTVSQRVLCLLLTVATLFGALGITVGASNGEYKGENSTAATLEEMQNLVGVTSYEQYLAEYATLAKTPNRKTPIKIFFSTDPDYVYKDGEYNILDFAREWDQNGKQKYTDFIDEKNEQNAVLVKDSPICGPDKDSLGYETWNDFTAEDAATSVYLPSMGTAAWKINITDDDIGMYYIKFTYYSAKTSESSTSSIEKKFLIDDKIPFDEAGRITLDKSWEYDYNSKVTKVEISAAEYSQGKASISYNNPVDEDGGYVKTVVHYERNEYTGKFYRVTTVSSIRSDKNNNSMAPEAVAVPTWSTYTIKDSSGYYTEDFMFFMGKGDHFISLVAERDPVVLKSIELIPVEVFSDSTSSTLKAYSEYRAQHSGKPQGSGEVQLEAEFPDYVSDASVAASNDNTSAGTFPTNHSSQLYNVIGENGYSTVGQWAAYNFYVPTSGMYKISMRFIQNALQGMFVCRTIKIAGKGYTNAGEAAIIPFKEAADLKFNYSKEWQSEFLGDGNGTDFEFYFEAGQKYTLYLECSLGSLKQSIQAVEHSLSIINDCYLQVLQLTGADADENRDYRFDEILPGVLRSFLEQAKALATEKQKLEELCGSNGSHIATLDTIALLLVQMGSDNGDNVAKNMGSLKSYLGTLGTWINNSKQSKIMVDALFIVPSGTEEVPREADAGFWSSLWFEIKSFFASFWVNYDEMGLTGEISEDVQKIDVWLATGRDQSQIWRSMIDANDGYTNSTGTAAALKLVTGGTLLPSILSGKGPDVYIGLGAADVINYAIRGAVRGISGNDPDLSAEDNSQFTTKYYTYRDESSNYTTTTEERTDKGELTFVTKPYSELVLTEKTKSVIEGKEEQVFAEAAVDTVRLLNVAYGIPQTMSFSMMFYRMDVLANLNVGVPETWSDLLSCLPIIQANNMSIGVDYIAALDFMIYQKGGSLWKYTDASKYDPMYAGAKIDLDSDIALEAFEYVCRLYSDYSFPVAYDAANRFRTGEMPILIGGYCALYNQLVVYATEIEGLWEFCSLPGDFRDADGDGIEELHYESLAGVGATVILRGCKGDELRAAWQFVQWNSSADVQATYGNKMVALIGPSAKYEAANLQALEDLSWTASEKLAIRDQMNNMCSIVNYPGSYIYNRYMKFAFLDVVNEGANAKESLLGYIDAINSEITRKREEFKDRGIWYVGKDGQETPIEKS
ncbi:MAG: extracellular solute-binding protein [Clostridia bacterium]|nr:extracellular solute-binding protein [Clostridia bacterium]